MAPRATRVAVVDLGTNSTRLLVAEMNGDELREVERTTRVTRLGEGVDATGALAGAAMERVFAALADFRAAIDRLRADRVVAVATSAVREARNGPAFCDAVGTRHAIDVHTISGEEEARLTFAGATAGGTPREEETVVVDVGGGSTELVGGTPGGAPGFHASTPLGSVRQTERHLLDDPPRHDQLAALGAEASTTIEAAVPAAVRRRVRVGIAVAGTPTSLAAIEQELDPYDPARVHGYELGRDGCERMLASLAAVALPERRAVRGLHPDRAATIVAGTAILIEAMAAFGLDRVSVSERDLLHGAAVELARSGAAEG